jgi:hypothetical protein
VHLTGGSLRLREAISTPRHFPVQSALSTPAHQQVTLTVRQPVFLLHFAVIQNESLKMFSKSEGQMNIEFERTIQDVIDFNLFHMAHSSTIKRQLLLMQVLTGLLVIPLVFSIFYLLYHSIDAFAIIVSVLAGVIAFALYPQSNRKSTIKRIRKVLSEGNNNALLGRQVVSLSPEGVFIKNQAAESKFIWSAVDKIAENDKHVYLYTSSINALVIPKNCFQSEKEKQEFLEYINKYRQPR